MLDKNPKKILVGNLEHLQKGFADKNPNIVCSSKPFIKSEFLNRLIDLTNFPIVFFDFDLLYSGYVKSEMIKKNENVKIFRINRENFMKNIEELIEQISKEKVLVIFDSLNGFYNIFDELESSRFINAIIMLISSAARETNSQIIATAMGIRNDSKEWVLSPSGRHLIEYKKSGMYYLSKSETRLDLNQIEK